MMMRLTEAVFINSCQTFIFFFSFQASGIDRGNAVHLSTEQGDGGSAGAGGLSMTHYLSSQLYKTPLPILKMKMKASLDRAPGV